MRKFILLALTTCGLFTVLIGNAAKDLKPTLKKTATVPMKKLQSTQHSVKKTSPFQLDKSILGNPISGRDSYTINAKQTKQAGIECIFINTGDKPMIVSLWTTPDSNAAEQQILLKSGSKARPYQITQKLLLPLKKHWWCAIKAPFAQQQPWQYCAYFGIGDAHIKTNAFAASATTPRAKEVSYHCRLSKVSANVSFFE